MRYSFTAIADTEIPRAANPLFQHLLDTYASETNKVIAVWQCFEPADLASARIPSLRPWQKF